MRLRRLGYAVAGALLAAALPACTSAPATPVGPVGNGWTSIGLPAQAETPVTLTAYLGTLVVGTATADPEAVPGLLAFEHGAWQRLPVRPSSPYAKLAEWLSIQPADEGKLVAVGGARGGAHANVRWTVWTGSLTDGLTEQEQTFETFGGWGAGDQTGVVVTGSGPMLVGSWQSARTGLDIDVWLPHGSTWVRQDPAGTPLESTPTELAAARGAFPVGPGAIVAGSVLHLGDGVVRQASAVWRSSSGNTGWTRIDLPGGTASEAVSATCAGPLPDTCTIIGWVDGKLAVWRLDPTGARRVDGIPEVTVTAESPMPAPVAVGASIELLVTEGTGTVLVRESAQGWTREPGPAGAVVAAVLVGSTLYAVLRSPDGSSRLWTYPA